MGGNNQVTRFPGVFWEHEPCADNNSANILTLLFLNKLLLLASRGSFRKDMVEGKAVEQENHS